MRRSSLLLFFYPCSIDTVSVTPVSDLSAKSSVLNRFDFYSVSIVDAPSVGSIVTFASKFSRTC